VSGEVRVERRDGVVHVTLAQPGRRNALTYEMYDALEAACRDAAADPSVRALVLRGADGSFAGGTDIRHLADLRSGEDGVVYEARMRKAQEAVLDLRVPVLAVVEGVCVGGGLVLAALADLVVCTPDARFGSPIARTLGNTLSATSLARLHACLGRRRTAEILLTGRLLDAEEARAAGFVTAVVPADELEARVEDTLEAVRACAPLSLWSFKEVERRLDAAAAQVPVEDVYRRVYGSRDFREGVEAFLAHRPARYEGR
jgi:enoyl-CoA hydratase/carnithine racemase